MPDLDAAAIVRSLNRHGVQFVVIGGMAAQIHDLAVPAISGPVRHAAPHDLEHLDRFYESQLRD